ncbi:MAG: molybdenum cofactor biosynthesis protein MoaE [Thermoplasmata archaeon]|nr:MAG: molybdenum cofactor biosynthesis protein MoaE [Thermoplasmata archaeon]
MSKDKVIIQEEDFSLDEVLNTIKKTSKDIGAVVMFIGIVREYENGKKVKYLAYEHYPKMAEKYLEELREEAISKFNLKDLIVIHRIGKRSPGENVVVIAAASEHRKEAFEACSWYIEELKKVVPIWKRFYTV